MSLISLIMIPPSFVPTLSFLFVTLGLVPTVSTSGSIFARVAPWHPPSWIPFSFASRFFLTWGLGSLWGDRRWGPLTMTLFVFWFTALFMLSLFFFSGCFFDASSLFFNLYLFCQETYHGEFLLLVEIFEVLNIDSFDWVHSVSVCSIVFLHGCRRRQYVLLVETQTLDPISCLKNLLWVLFLNHDIWWVYYGLSLISIDLLCQLFDLKLC